MKTKEEIKEWLLENCVDECGNLYLAYLDFSDFNGDVLFRHITVKKDLYQDYQTVGGDLYQERQETMGDLIQNGQQVNGYLHQNFQTVKNNLYQDGQNVKKTLYQDNQKVERNLIQNYQTVKGVLIQNYQTFGKALYTQDTKDLKENKNFNDAVYYTNEEEHNKQILKGEK